MHVISEVRRSPAKFAARGISAASLFLCLASGSALHAQDQGKVIRGTINEAFANENGIVVLTDSMETYLDASGAEHHIPTAKKLFRIDDETVCAIAGFGSETFPSALRFNTDVAGILADYKEQLVESPISQFEAKLRSLAFLIGFYINTSATVADVAEGPLTSGQDYTFELILAGYDTDGTAKLGKVVLTETVRQEPGGGKFWTPDYAAAVESVGGPFVHLVSGYRDVADRVLESPRSFASSAAVRRYAESRQADGGASLSIAEMEALANYIAKKTAQLHPEVGGPNQIAVLSDDRIANVDAPDFPRPRRPLRFSVIEGGRFREPPASVQKGARSVMLLIGLTVDGVKGMDLNGLFFYGCEIRDSILIYNGGITSLDPSGKNKVIDSWLLLFPTEVTDSSSKTELRALRKNFAWRTDQPH
jgi:20S proteasome alpha/beta subunit